jgi:hypothetical protein
MTTGYHGLRARHVGEMFQVGVARERWIDPGSSKGGWSRVVRWIEAQPRVSKGSIDPACRSRGFRKLVELERREV